MNIGPCLDMYPSGSKVGATSALLNTTKIWKSNGTITVSFKDPDSAWSQIGSDSSRVNPSMNLGWLDPPFESFTMYGKTFTVSNKEKRNGCGQYQDGTYKCPDNYIPGGTVLHEFAHSLGFYHEHQNGLENSGLKFKSASDIRNIMINDCQNNCNDTKSCNPSNCSNTTWPVSTIQTNIVDRYSCKGDNCNYKDRSILDGSAYDSRSLMLYPVKESWIASDSPIKSTVLNYVYSDIDKCWLQKQYPLSNKPIKLTVKFVDDISVEWKKYWVCYCVTKYLAPLVSIDFDFYDSNGTKLGTTEGTVKVTVNCDSPVVTKPPVVTSPPVVAPRPVVAIVPPPVTNPPVIAPRPVVIAPPQPIVPATKKTSKWLPWNWFKSYESFEQSESSDSSLGYTLMPENREYLKQYGDLLKDYQNNVALWKSTFQEVGSMGNYPRPQGNLPMNPWGLTPNAQNSLQNLYENVLANPTYGNER
jgi:hypothetical protein